MRYYQCGNYPVEFVLSENMDKCFAPHNHVGHYVVSLVIQGTVTVQLEGRESVCHGGDVFMIPPYEMHSVCLGKDARLLSVCMGTAFVAETDCIKAEGIVRELLEDIIEQGILGKAQKEKLLSAMSAVYRIRDKGVKERDEGIRILVEQMIGYPESELSIDALAADIFVSKYYLIRKFKKSIGMTPRQFCIQNRIRKAQRLLDGERTVGEISAEMGFYDQSHFDKAFRRIVGISPSEYIRSKIVMKRTI